MQLLARCLKWGKEPLDVSLERRIPFVCKPKKLQDDQIFIAVRRDLKTSSSARLSVTPVNEAMIAKLISSTLSYHPKILTTTSFDNELDA